MILWFWSVGRSTPGRHGKCLIYLILIKQWDSISIHVSSFLDHYTTDGVIWFYLLVLKTRVTTEHGWGVVGGHIVVYVVIHPYWTWFMPHITLIKTVG